MLPTIIGLEQYNFVLSRQIVDNIVIYQEIMHTMRLTERRKKYMTFKIDLEKAYDQFNWNFVEWVIKMSRLYNQYVENIMKCIRTASMSILWNG